MTFEIILGLIVVAIIWVAFKPKSKSNRQDPVVPYKVEAPQQSAANTIVETPAKMKIPTLATEVTVTEVTAAPVKAKKKASKKAVKKPKLNLAK
jgi:hypothetical protein